MKFLMSPTPPLPLRFLAACFRRPFKGLWLIVMAYYAGSFLIVSRSHTLRGNLPDPDDYMYLVQMLDWIKGQGWYDNVQHRLNTPDGMVIPFSRFAMMPMAALVLLFKLFGQSFRDSSILMAMVYPLILLGGFLITLRKIAESVMPKDWSGVTAAIALFSTPLIYMFQPGHIDHHGLIIWVVAGTLLCALRMMEKPDDIRWGLGAGFILALGMTIALEILPWVLIIAGLLGLWAIIKGRSAARHAFAFALSLHLASIVFLLLTRPPSDFFVFDILAYSAVYVFLTGSIAICFAGVAATAEAALPLRMVVGVVLALLLGFFFIHLFPDLITGPYGALDPDMVELILGEAGEAIPLMNRMQPFIKLAAYLSPIALAIGAGIYFAARAKKEQRWPWVLIMGLLLPAFGLTVFYQSRFAGAMGMLAVIPLAVFLQKSWIWIGARSRGLFVKVCARAGLVILSIPLLGVIIPSIAGVPIFNNGLLLFPAGTDVGNRCDAHLLEKTLNNPAGLGMRQHSIIADTWLGPELLFRTPDNVMAAPYLESSANLDSYRFFSTLLPEEAKTIFDRHCLDLVVSCSTYPASYLQSYLARPGVKTPHEFGLHFIQLLMDDNPPDWLTEADTPPALKNYAVYQLQPSVAEGRSCPVK